MVFVLHSADNGKEEDADNQGDAAVRQEHARGCGIAGKQAGERDDEQVAKADGEIPEAGCDAFHGSRCLRIGEFEARGADENFCDGEDAVGDELPDDGECGSLLKAVLQPGYNGEGY